MSRRRRRARPTRRGWLLAVAVATALVGALVVSLVSGRIPWQRAAAAPAAAASPAAATPSPAPSPPAPTWRPATPGPVPAELATLAGDDLATDAPLVVVADAGSRLDRDLATWLAVRLQAPLVDAARGLPDDVEVVVAVGEVELPADVTAEVRRVVRTAPAPPPAVATTPSPAPTSPATDVPETAGFLGVDRAHDLRARAEAPVSADLDAVTDLLAAASPASPTGVTLLVRPDTVATTTVATALALGHDVAVTGGDRLWDAPRLPATVGAAPDAVVALLGAGWDGADRDLLAWQLAVLRRGVELPGGGYELFPGRRLVALYGHPEGGALGVLGEQPVGEAVTRAEEQAAVYDELVDEPVVPAFDLIATVASAGAGDRGDYSRRTPVATLRPWVDAARDAGLYVVLDLQSGRADLLSQAREYEELLREPHVGLALDPEWRLAPDQVHLRQIGSLSGHEVNEVAGWLAELTRSEGLPQKLLIVHQFQLGMIRDRDVIDTTHPELAVLIQMDGQGSQGAKLGTYATIVRDAPAGVWWGWKNFHDEDVPTRSPADTVALDPSPVFISYQ